MIGSIRLWAAVAAIAAGTMPIAGRAAEPGAYLDYNGLAYVSAAGRVRHVPFGTGESKMREVAERLYGAPESFTNPECGAGPIDFAEYANGLALHFQDGVFVGWSARAPGITTLDGIGVGAPVAELEAAAGALEIEETTLGYEFWYEDFFGIADAPEGAIETLWGGTACNFR